MINWKVVIGSGAVAVVLSLLTGIISGVSFGALLLRALLGGAIFCVIGAAISSVVSKYLPELFSSRSGEEADTARPERAVDIILPDENPHRSEEEDLGGDTGYSSGFGPGEPEESGEDERDGFSAPDRNTMVEEIEEFRGDRSESREPEPRPRGGAAFDQAGAAEELPELEPDESYFPSAGTERYGTRNFSDLSKTPGDSQSVDVLGHRASADEIAKAIRTALKKDQKG